jgi:hypothetical protein
VGSNGAVIPAGARAVLTVTRLKRSKNVNDPIVIEFGLSALSFGGQLYPADGAVTSAQVERTRSASGGKDAQKVLGGAAAGAIAGQVLGKTAKSTVIGAAAGAVAGAAAAQVTADYEGCIPSGGTIQITLRSPVQVRV